MAAKSMIQVACYLTRKQHAELRRLSKQTHIPVSIYLRSAVDKLLQEQRK